MPEPIRTQLRRLYESNIRGAGTLGAWWATDHYRGCIAHLDEHPRGPLTERMRRDATRFGTLIKWPAAGAAEKTHPARATSTATAPSGKATTAAAAGPDTPRVEPVPLTPSLAICCPVHGAGYARCLGCLAEAAAATQKLEMRAWWRENFSQPEIDALAAGIAWMDERSAA